jgi:hypothetical protein
MGDDDASFGKASLRCAIIGVVLPGCLAALGPASALLGGVLFISLEWVALGFGIAARATVTGKAGLVISGILLVSLFLALLLFYPFRLENVPRVVPPK